MVIYVVLLDISLFARFLGIILSVEKAASVSKRLPKYLV